MSLAIVAADAAAEVDLAAVRARMVENRRRLAHFFSQERSDIFLGLDACALARHHAFLGGPPGLAKSLIVRTWSAQFAAGGAVYRDTLLTRQTTEQDVLYFLDVPSLVAGQRKYLHADTVSEAHFAFLDECFKATGSLLNSLLAWLNERQVRGGYHSPLVSCVGASNEFPEDDSTEALEDRFLVRFWLSPLSHGPRTDFLRARARGDKPPALETITLEELRAAQAAVERVQVHETVLVQLSMLVDTLKPVGIDVSDRRIGWCVEILRAIAWLSGDDVAEHDHVDFLRHVLWRRPSDIPQVEAALAHADQGIIGEVRRLQEAALTQFNAARGSASWPAQAASVADAIASVSVEVRKKFPADTMPPKLRARVGQYLAALKEPHAEALAAAKQL